MRRRIIILIWLFTGFGSGCATPWKTARDIQVIDRSNEVKQHYWEVEAAHRGPKDALKLKPYRVPLPPYEDDGIQYEGGVIETRWYE